MPKKTRRVTVGDGLTERHYDVEQLVAPVTRDELEEYDRDAADYSSDPWAAYAAPLITAAKRRLEQIECDPSEGAFHPHVGEGWYCRQLIELGDRVTRFAFEWEIAAQPLIDAMTFGELARELEIRREHNVLFKKARATRERQSEAGQTSRRKRPFDDDYTIGVWDQNYAELRGKVLADQATAATMHVSPRTIRDLRLRFGR